MRLWPFRRKSSDEAPSGGRQARPQEPLAADVVGVRSVGRFDGRYPATRRSQPPQPLTEIANRLVTAAELAQEEAKNTLNSRGKALCGQARAAGAEFGSQRAEEEVAQARHKQRAAAAAAAAEAQKAQESEQRRTHEAERSASESLASGLSKSSEAEPVQAGDDLFSGGLVPLDLQVHQEQARRTAKETLESVREIVEASLVEHENHLRELISVLDVAVDEEERGRDEEQAKLSVAAQAVKADAEKPYEQQDQMVQHEAWVHGLGRDDHASNLRVAREQLVRSTETLVSIDRLRQRLSDRVKEQSEEAAEVFNDAALTSMIERRSELLSEGPKRKTPELSLRQRIGRWGLRLLAVIGAVSLVVVGVWAVRNELLKKAVPSVTGVPIKVAVARGQEVGLRVKVIGGAPASTRRKVCAQAPLAGEESRTMTVYAGEACAPSFGSAASSTSKGGSRAR